MLAAAAPSLRLISVGVLLPGPGGRGGAAQRIRWGGPRGPGWGPGAGPVDPIVRHTSSPVGRAAAASIDGSPFTLISIGGGDQRRGAAGGIGQHPDQSPEGSRRQRAEVRGGRTEAAGGERGERRCSFALGESGGGRYSK